MAKAGTGRIRTYTLAERATHLDFSIHDERTRSRIEQAHRHEYFQVQLNLAGSTRQHIGAVDRPLAPGGLSFVLPYRVHRIAHPAGSRFYVLSFSQRFLRPELAPFLYQEFLDFTLAGGDLQRVHEACRAMAAENARRGFCSTEVIRANLLTLLCTVCRRYERELLALASGQAQAASRRDTLARVSRFVREHLERRISLADAAAAVALSPNYLAHLLKKHTGQTLTELVTERRMERARELLAHTDMRVAEIARAVGFDDEAYFARRFRQWYDVSPREFRLRCVAA